MRCPFLLKADDSGLFRCYGRVPGYNPIFVPQKHSVTIWGSSSDQEHGERSVLDPTGTCYGRVSSRSLHTPLDSPITSRLTSF